MELDRSPVSTSLVTRQEIESRNIRHVDQALTLMEGVNATRSRGPGDNDFGLGLRGFSGRGGQSRTLILVDGQPVNNSYIGSVNWSMFPVSEMERVEVARGPFSSLYGGNAMGGVVNMITRPVDRRQVELFGQYGNRDTMQYSARVAGRFFDKLGLSAGYTRFQTGGYPPQEILRTPVTAAGAAVPVTGVIRWGTPTGGTTYQVGEQGRYWFNQDAWRIRAEYSPTTKSFLSLQYFRQNRIAGFDQYTTFLRDAAGRPVDEGLVSFIDGGVTRRLSLAPSNFIGVPTGASTNIVQAQWLQTIDSAWNLRVAAGLTDSPREWFVSPGAAASQAGGPGSYTNTLNQAWYGNIQATRQSSGNTTIFGTETRHDRARTAAQGIPVWTMRANGGDFTAQAFGRTINQAAYVQHQYTPVEGLSVVAGGRWDFWKAYNGGNQTTIHQIPARYPDRDSNALTGKVAAAYTVKGWQVRGSVGNAFRNPSVYEMYRDFVLVGNLLLGNPNVLPEKLLAYELGAGRSLGSRVSFNATVFENRVTDLIYRVTDFAADPTGRIRRLTNAGLGRTRGLEFFARQPVSGWLNLQQSYTYTNATITRNDALPSTVGKRVPWVPMHTLAYMANAVKGRYSAAWSGRYVGHQYSTDTNIDTTRGVPGAYDPFFETDISAGVQLTSRLSAVATCDNLLDRRYWIFHLAQGRTVLAGIRLRL
jgi:iron complex outermembrane recepter protein